jgi:site-specific DNA-methyltransferase (adenine-specific)
MEFNSTDLFDSTEPPTCGKPVLNAAFTSDLVSEVYNMDCIQGMKEYPDKYFDLAIVDPPYGIGFSSKEQSNFGKGGINHEYKEWDIVPPFEYWIELFRVSKNQIIWGGNYFTEHLPVSRCWLSWYKMQEFSTNEFELAWTSFDRTSKQFNLSRVQAYANQIKIHPTQKPVKLYEWSLTHFAEKGQKILDTHLGSGSSRIAAHNLGFHFVGFELDKEYYEAQEKRFRTHISQQRLF